MTVSVGICQEDFFSKKKDPSMRCQNLSKDEFIF